MKQENLFSRYNLLWLFILCYLLPMLGLSVYGALFPRLGGNWNIFCLGFILTTSGSLILFWAVTRWESILHLNMNSIAEHQEESHSSDLADYNKQIINPEEHDFIKRSLAEAQQVQIRLLSEIDILTEENRKISLAKSETLNQTEKLQVELEHTKKSARRELELQQNHIRELQEKIADLKGMHEKKQQQMIQLETKVGGLTNEIKTLLQFAEAHTTSLVSNEPVETHQLENPSQAEKNESVIVPQYYVETPIQSAQEASQQLKNCLDIAQKIKGSQRFGSQIYSFLDSPADSFSLDLRRLCDRLRGEAQSAILLYSPKDSQMLFASNLIKTLSGWSPDKFAQNFFDILDDEAEWKHGVNSLVMRSESQIQLQLKSRSGGIIVINAALGTIPTGIFRNHIIAVLYTSSDVEATSTSINNFS